MDYILNEEQRRLAEDHMKLIDGVIKRHFWTNSEIYGMEYDDLHQVGALGLCKAASTYSEDNRVIFETYAYKLIRNEIMDHIRTSLRKYDSYSRYMSDVEAFFRHTYHPSPDHEVCERLTVDALHEFKNRHSDTARKGVEAMFLKIAGYSSEDIAERYNVKPNYINACISRARTYLKKDKHFLQIIE